MALVKGECLTLGDFTQGGLQQLPILNHPTSKVVGGNGGQGNDCFHTKFHCRSLGMDSLHYAPFPRFGQMSLL